MNKTRQPFAILGMLFLMGTLLLACSSNKNNQGVVQQPPHLTRKPLLKLQLPPVHTRITKAIRRRFQ